VLVGARGGDAAARRAVDEPDLQEVGFVDVLERAGILADRRGERGDADRAAAELVDDGEEELAVDLVEAVVVDLQQLRAPGGPRRRR
jgi:hypothetical protein